MLIKKRIQKDIWQHLYEFPLLEFEKEQNINDVLKIENLPFLCGDGDSQIITISKQYKHILSHQHIYATFIHVKIKSLLHQNAEVIKTTKLKKFPVSRLVHMYMQDNNLI